MVSQQIERQHLVMSSPTNGDQINIKQATMTKNDTVEPKGLEIPPADAFKLLIF